MSGEEPEFNQKLELAAQRTSELGLAFFNWLGGPVSRGAKFLS